MKKLFVLPALIIIAFLLTFQMSTTSCTKTNPITDTVSVMQKDTALTTTILTANSWKIQEMRATYGGNYIFYVRGGSNNTQSFDNEYITFNSNGTGLYVDNSGGQSTFTWNFTDATNTKIIWIWNLPSPVTITWDYISYYDAALHYTEYYIQFGENELESATRIPK